MSHMAEKSWKVQRGESLRDILNEWEKEVRCDQSEDGKKSWNIIIIIF